MTVNLAQLRALLAVVDEGGFSAAAPALGISQSAVSHAIAALERTVGSPVLHRTKQPQLTTFGNRLVEHARAAVGAAAAINDLVAENANQPTGTIRLAAPATVCQGLLPALLAQWRGDLPGVKIRLFEGEDHEIVEWLAEKTTDAAVLVDPDGHDGVQIGADEFQALLPRDHPLAGEDEIDIPDLDDDPFLLSDGGCERHVRELYRRTASRLRPTHRVREGATLIAMVQAGIGVSIVPGLMASMIDRRAVLVPLKQKLKRRLVLTGPASGSWHPAVTALVGATRSRV
ncbi:LysR family transcriptional regulator [Kibdelosporangium phytohabitans]|uniref:Transcriptional regulator n=1 Tax=Kibdelosporangium phytohabitans TaxID=860235 RepID=A0A0N9HY36_9PSEU|nr:LysR family transcriptional regulator [Kibdelosporangium phytohabitans]ALG07163.1 transcriptional regulator [Kibdelosporangium phytohabitans]MBE1468496.1 DNA-binding transcriptional LysR family regulator [Kibdelosporangium phytohabitans]